MVYLVSAIISSALVSVCMRISEKYVHNTMAMFTANYTICFVISRFHMGDPRLFTSENGIKTAIWLGIATGFLYLAGFILFQQNIHYNGIVLSSASMKLGAVLIPVMAAVLFFREGLGGPQFFGVILAVLAILLINIEKEDIRHGNKKIWLVVLLMVNGLSDTMANIYQKTGTEALKNHYLSFTFLAALFLAFASALKKRKPVTFADVCFGLLIGIPNYYSARFILSALGKIPAVIVYPVYSVGTIITITLVGLIVFREKLSRQKKGALALILAALVMLNMDA